jgi:hypothetical protein
MSAGTKLSAGALRYQAARPAADRIEQVQRRLGCAPLAFLCGNFVKAVRD